MFVTISKLPPNPIFVRNSEASPNRATYNVLIYLLNFRLVNALAYCTKEYITNVESFIVQTQK